MLLNVLIKNQSRAGCIFNLFFIFYIIKMRNTTNKIFQKLYIEFIYVTIPKVYNITKNVWFSRLFIHYFIACLMQRPNFKGQRKKKRYWKKLFFQRGMATIWDVAVLETGWSKRISVDSHQDSCCSSCLSTTVENALCFRPAVIHKGTI